MLAYQRRPLSLSNQIGRDIAAFGFVCFLIGRFTGAVC